MPTSRPSGREVEGQPVILAATWAAWQAEAMNDQRGSQVSPRFVVGAILVVLLVVFIFENRTRTDVRFIFPVVTAPLWVALLGAALFGGVAGALLTRQRHPKS